MLYHNHPKWKKFRSYLLDLPSSTPAVTIFSRKAIQLHIDRGDNEYDVGVLGTIEMSIMNIIDDSFFCDGVASVTKQSNRILGGTIAFGVYIDVEWRPLYRLQCAIGQFICDVEREKSNTSSSLSFYTKDKIAPSNNGEYFPYDLLRSMQYLPEERCVVNVGDLHDMIVQIDKAYFLKSIKIDD